MSLRSTAQPVSTTFLTLSVAGFLKWQSDITLGGRDGGELEAAEAEGVWRAVERVPGCFTINTGNRPGPPGVAKRSLTLSITNWVLHDAFVWARGARNRQSRWFRARASMTLASKALGWLADALGWSDSDAPLLRWPVLVGLGRAVALHCRPSTPYQIC